MANFRKYLLVIFAFLSLSSAFAQHEIPSVTAVNRELFSVYELPNNVNHIQYAKTKRGWEIAAISYADGTEKTLYSALYWSLSSGKYKKLKYKKHKKRLSKEELDEQPNYSRYLANQYNYFRCIYFGYPQADWDVIREFGNKENLTEVQLEGLARAYWTYALGYVNGESLFFLSNLNWPSRQFRQEDDLPSQLQIDSFLFYAELELKTYRKLIQKNPNYSVLVGHVRNKLANEHMDLFFHMARINEYDKAMYYLRQANYDPSMLSYAKNILGPLPQNTILFTNGDNDTYPLWYLQKMHGFRNDIRVINLGLLGSKNYMKYICSEASVFGPIKSQYAALANPKTPLFGVLSGTLQDTISFDSFVHQFYGQKDSGTYGNILRNYIQIPYRSNTLLFKPRSSYVGYYELNVMDIISSNQKPVFYTPISYDEVKNWNNAYFNGYYSFTDTNSNFTVPTDSAAALNLCLQQWQAVELDPVANYDNDRSADLFIGEYMFVYSIALQYAHDHGNVPAENMLIGKLNNLYPDGKFHPNSRWTNIIYALYRTGHTAAGDMFLNQYLASALQSQTRLVEWLQAHDISDQPLSEYESYQYGMMELINSLQGLENHAEQVQKIQDVINTIGYPE